MEYNFFKLLEISNELEKNNKSLAKEDPVAFKIFFNFLVRIEENLHYSEKQKYIKLAKDFLEDKITADSFSLVFMDIYEGITTKSIQMQKDQPLELENFLKPDQPDQPDRSELGSLVTRIYGSCDSFNLDPTVTEEELKVHAQELLLELKGD